MADGRLTFLLYILFVWSFICVIYLYFTQSPSTVEQLHGVSVGGSVFSPDYVPVVDQMRFK